MRTYLIVARYRLRGLKKLTVGFLVIIASRPSNFSISPYSAVFVTSIVKCEQESPSRAVGHVVLDVLSAMKPNPTALSVQPRELTAKDILQNYSGYVRFQQTEYNRVSSPP